ncbi:MAG: hypothetical protein U0Y68_26035 [Blastocatellia bacterium]
MPSNSVVATNLLRAVLAKAGLEFLLLLLVVSYAAYSHLNPPIRGAIDVTDATRIAGWAYDPREPNTPLEVQLFVDDKFASERRADEPREDLVRAAAAQNPAHGFTFAVPPLQLLKGRHRITVYALRAGGGQNKTLLALTKKEYWLEVP